MLDITFYSRKGEITTVDLTEERFQFLAKSNFSKISKSVMTTVWLKREEDDMDFLYLGGEFPSPSTPNIRAEIIRFDYSNRKQYSDFIRKEIVSQGLVLLEAIGDKGIVDLMLSAKIQDIRSLYLLLAAIEDENNEFMDFELF